MKTIRIDDWKTKGAYILKLIQVFMPIKKIRISHWNKNIRIVETNTHFNRYMK